MTLTSKQRAYLRSLAQNADALFQIGKDGVTPQLTAAIEESFNNRELVKLTVLKTADGDLREIGEMIAGRTRSTLVEVIGRKIVLYKQDPDDPKIVLPKATAKKSENG
ncbi:MAG: YhbY family RNA-binding protein [Lachnospiraceae bacterium]|nr:YhbY family RNA-binding protein [Lachnospiraceae bacterium]